jgi:aspartyl-tRNA(Asn)/glutamyl-tRNA(Gln) amidotransferase subunit B
MYNDWEAVIGLEIHAQLNTKSKIFSCDSAQFTHGDNDHISSVSLGMPGTLPVLNMGVVEMAIKAGLALNCEINNTSVFERKNYFYPDLAKGYQISQYKHPICGKGFVKFYLNDKESKINITRAHLEEDAGKSIHQDKGSLINYNRAGVPLLEIVSEPEIRSPEEAAEYARTIRQILRYVEVCDGNLEEGSLRCDCNVSIRKKGKKELGVKVELKNINSFRFIEKAIEYEIHRQIDVLESGEKIIQETRLYDSTKNKTQSMRTKEEADDYRYFPDPDLLPVVVEDKKVEELRSLIPESPHDKRTRFQSEYGISLKDSALLTEDLNIANYYESAIKHKNHPKGLASWILSDLFRELNQSSKSINESHIPSEELANLVFLIESGVISGNIAKKAFGLMWSQCKTAAQVIDENGWKQISNNNQLEEWVNEVIKNNPQQVEEFKSGKTKVMSFLMGQVMRISKGQANPGAVESILKEKMK